ncbi:hypothetical protein AKI39_00680 [Bordetella sp. H567]|uniref:hypothetical protein n=1 Tax=Bordetella sp. H567 TaxID=1697043 RepID=UPI00081C85C4|nr:hypothetical protein [Bordetella sp. H567]AOB29507.1 hypothetical protein AKI39_00680 [Bordetella sp. H567]
MFAGNTDRTDDTPYLVPAAPSTASAFGGTPSVGVTPSGYAFKPQPAIPVDIYAELSHARRATQARRGTFGLFRFGWSLRGHRTAESTVRRSGSGGGTSQALSGSGLLRGAGTSGGAGCATDRMPVPPRFLPLMNDLALPPVVLSHAPSAGNAIHTAPARDAPWPGPRAPSWPRRMLSAVAYRLRYLAAPGEHRKALRMAYMREKVMGSAYVFLNAIQSDEPLLRHFVDLRRQVRRLDRRAGVVSGISDESARVLLEAADRTASARRQVRDRILAFHREELLYDVVGADEFHRADAVLLVVESRMVAGIALYGDALRCLAAADVAQDAICEAIDQILEPLFAREAAAEGMQPRDCAVARLPYRTLVRLHGVLSAGLACGGAYQTFMQELLRIVEAKVGLRPRASSADAPLGGAD